VIGAGAGQEEEKRGECDLGEADHATDEDSRIG
jgi:hypothetical protein